MNLLSRLFENKEVSHFAKLTRDGTYPEAYESFLSKIPTGGKTVKSDEFVNYLKVYDRASLLQAQRGYSFNPIQKQRIAAWPQNYLVIASDSGDPYVIDLSQENPAVLTAEHGADAWNFKQYSQNLGEFATMLSL